MQLEPATHKDLVDLLGEVDDLVMERVIDTGASVAEVAEALDAIEDERQFGEQHHIPSSGRVTEVKAILTELIPEDDEEAAVILEDRP